MSITLASYQQVQDTCRSFSFTIAANPSTRKALFGAIAALYPPEQMANTAFASGVYYRLAERVKAGQEFADHPESIRFLKPKAERYTQIFQRIMTQVETSASPQENLETSLTDLRKTHIQFMNAYIAEYERVYPESSDVICVNYKDTINLFVDAMTPEIELHRELIAVNDPCLFSRIPKLAIEKLLKEPAIAPELLESFAGMIIKKRASYNGLSQEEKEKLHLKLLGVAVELEPTTLELFKSIEQISYLVQRSDAGKTNLVFRETINLLGKL